MPRIDAACPASCEFESIDISLDPFPQNGGVSTWESLQMGVPVVSQLGHSACSRAGGAIVKAVGLDDWVAEDDNGYIAIARKYAGLPAELRALRAGLPGGSPVRTPAITNATRGGSRTVIASSGAAIA